jgi:RNA polymerase sigma-70 factor (ECF subfamily)
VERVPDGRAEGGEVDRQLVESAQRGDKAAFVDLVRSRVDRLFALAHRILRDVDRAEDALQDALVIAWRDLRGLRDPDRFDAWLHRLVVHECIDHAARERRRAANLRVLPVEGQASPDDMLTLADRDELERGFRRLSPDQRAILVLHYYEGYPLASIADMLGIPPGTVRSRLHYARDAMRAALDADARTATIGGRPA